MAAINSTSSCVVDPLLIDNDNIASEPQPPVQTYRPGEAAIKQQ